MFEVTLAGTEVAFGVLVVVGFKVLVLVDLGAAEPVSMSILIARA